MSPGERTFRKPSTKTPTVSSKGNVYLEAFKQKEKFCSDLQVIIKRSFWELIDKLVRPEERTLRHARLTGLRGRRVERWTPAVCGMGFTLNITWPINENKAVGFKLSQPSLVFQVHPCLDRCCCLPEPSTAPTLHYVITIQLYIVLKFKSNALIWHPQCCTKGCKIVNCEITRNVEEINVTPPCARFFSSFLFSILVFPQESTSSLHDQHQGAEARARWKKPSAPVLSPQSSVIRDPLQKAPSCPD